MTLPRSMAAQGSDCGDSTAGYSDLMWMSGTLCTSRIRHL
ncbi:hypothetical protein J2801_006079 [Paraburkholderia phenoliruptrix]|nr:hypothetical protein [Paraburkholderia phenoliruptrix]